VRAAFSALAHSAFRAATAGALLAALGAPAALAGQTSGPPPPATRAPAHARRHAAATTATPDPFTSPALRRFLATRAGNITAAVYDVATGTEFAYRPSVREQTASIIKVDILATLLDELQARGASLTGSQLGLATQMIELSDNNAASDLWDDAGGGPAVLDYDEDAGMDRTSPNDGGYWGLSWTTAEDQIDLLRTVMLPNALLDLASREFEYELMRNVVQGERWGVSAGVAPDAVVALKNGWLPLPGGWQINSIGSVVGSRRHYLLAVLTDDDPTEGYGIATIEQISASVWSDLRPRPRRRR
jgi:beta-lactamase class A